MADLVRYADREFLVLEFSDNGMSTIGTAAAELSQLFRRLLNVVSSQSTYRYEATIFNDTGGSASSGLWDVTAGGLVSGSTVSVSTAVQSPVRSGALNLIPGHVYSVALWAGSGTAWFERARIVGTQ